MHSVTKSRKSSSISRPAITSVSKFWNASTVTCNENDVINCLPYWNCNECIMTGGRC
jgi:hypothetical protein